MGLNKHICINCGNSFETYFKDGKYCCRQCFYEYKRTHSTLMNRECLICGNKFNAKTDNSKFCSSECASISRRNRIECECYKCGSKFVRIKSEVEKNVKHFCSNDCRKTFKMWTQDELNILIDNYGIKTYEEISRLLINRSSSEVKRKAREIGIVTNNYWSYEEIDILMNSYKDVPIDGLMELLPNRSADSIIGKAHSLGLKTKNSIERVYTSQDDEYIAQEYPNGNTHEIAVKLKRSDDAITQRANKLGIYKNITRNYETLSCAVRKRMKSVRKVEINSFDGKCVITGRTDNLVIHHVIGFNIMLSEFLYLYGFNSYEEHELLRDETFTDLMDKFKRYYEKNKMIVCICDDIHKEFHGVYGYGDNTPKQWIEYISNLK